MIVKSTRPGILLVADAGLKLRKGETAEVTNATPQVEAAFKRGFLVEVTAESESAPKQEETTPTSPDKPDEPDLQELSALNANDAIVRVSQETDPAVLEGMMGSEKRKTVLDAMKLRLKEVQNNDAE